MFNPFCQDPGIQCYGGVLFSEVRDAADDTFCNLPPPVRYIAPWRTIVPAAPAAPINMASFNDRDAGCFHGDCTVQMSSGKTKMVRELVRGDILLSGAMIACVVRTVCSSQCFPLVHVEGGLRVTAWHPIRLQKNWIFPASLTAPILTHVDAVYSVVLSNANMNANARAVDAPSCQYITVDGVDCVSLGHNILNDTVASHPYFGTSAVTTDLQKCVGWERGAIAFEDGCFRRSAEGLVVGYDLGKEIQIA